MCACFVDNSESRHDIVCLFSKQRGDEGEEGVTSEGRTM